MRIMTSNIWGDYFNNPTEIRDDKLCSVYQKYNPDVLGFQEVTKSWYESSLFKTLRKNYYFVGTECLDFDNFVPLAIKKEIPLIAKGFEYLENTPDRSKAITWAVINRNGIKIALCNTHFWWMRGTEPEDVKRHIGVLDFSFEDHCKLRENNAKQLTRLMKELQNKYDCLVFAFGDMNATIEESVFEVYRKNGVQKLFDLAEQRDEICTTHGNPEKDSKGVFRGTKASTEYIDAFRKILCLPERKNKKDYFSSIDHIVGLGNSFKIKRYRIVEDTEALDATDHSPVFADVDFLL